MVVTWLHVSDFHFRGDDPHQDVVLKALIQSVRYFREQGRKPGMIFATGDVANSGKASEYEIATTFFDALLDAVGLERRRLFVVPGNHDVDRDRAVGLIRTLYSQEDADAYFNSKVQKFHITEKQGAFVEWYDRYFDGIRTFPRDSTCGPIEVVDVGGTALGVLPINSALFCQEDDDHDKLWVGRSCLRDALDNLRACNPRLTVALLHHPLHWLSGLESANIKSKLQATIDVVLRGHLHETDAESVAGITGTTVHMGAGAAYQKPRKWPKRALYVTLDCAGVTIFPIRYEDQPEEVWTADTSVFPHERNYEKHFPIRLGQTHPTPALPEPQAPVSIVEKYSEKIFDLQDELSVKIKQIEALQAENSSLADKNRPVEIIFGLVTKIIGDHRLSVTDYISYTSLFIKDKNLVEEFGYYLLKNR